MHVLRSYLQMYYGVVYLCTPAAVLIWYPYIKVACINSYTDKLWCFGVQQYARQSLDKHTALLCFADSATLRRYS